MKTFILCVIYFFTINLSLSFAADLPGNSNFLKNNPGASKQSFKRVFVGGDIGATFGDFTEVRISPMIGYNFSRNIAGGVSFVYRHSWNKVNQNTSNEATIQQNSIGGNAFVQYNPVPQGYLKAEYSYQVYKNSTTQNTTENIGVPFLFLGIGYTSSLSPNVNLNAGLKVDVLNNTNSPFKDFTPFFDVGITAGI